MSGRAYLLLILALVGALVALELLRERPLDLRVRLERSGDAPFDAEVFFESLPAWLGQPVEPVGDPAFVRLEDSTVTGRTYLFLTADFAPDEAEAERLLRFVARGNTVAVAAIDGHGPFFEALASPDTLDVDLGINPIYAGLFFGPALVGEVAPDSLRLAAPGVAGDYGFPVQVQTAMINGLDPARSEVLGTAFRQFGDDELATLVRIRHGRGEVLLSSTPLVFSNAALTGDGDAAAYVGAVLDALPAQPVWWDDHRKPYAEQARTPLRYVLSTPALRWGYLLLLAAGLLFLLFRARRWQRAIPVVTPPPNAQREFARTVGRLRFVHRDDRGLAERMAAHVRERLHAELRIADPALDAETARLAAARAGVPVDEAEALFEALRQARAAPSADALVRLDARIDRFFRHTGSPSARADRPPALP